MSTGDPDAADTLQPGMLESLGKQLDERPEIQAAEEAVRQAKEQFEKAQQYCQQLRSETAAELQGLREMNLGDLLDKSLALVRKHPGCGVCLAAFVGYFLGRIFRK